MEAIKMDISINEDDMYRFQMYHTYHTGQGILSIVLGILSIAVAIAAPIMAPERIQPLDIFFYGGVGVVFLGYYPFTLKKKAPLMIQNSPVLAHPLHYTFDEKGVTVESDEVQNEDEKKSLLPWENVFKVTLTKDQLLIYSNKINASILPLSQVTDLEGVKKLMLDKLPDHRVNFK